MLISNSIYCPKYIHGKMEANSSKIENILLVRCTAVGYQALCMLSKLLGDPKMVILPIYGIKTHSHQCQLGMPFLVFDPNMVILPIYGTKKHSHQCSFGTRNQYPLGMSFPPWVFLSESGRNVLDQARLQKLKMCIVLQARLCVQRV